ncbi:uncharacterized protein LOC123305164 [Chrysoperla carnea]|uniref:uncharacterized protein LOC123305164 n=1 Tax=Chrysoperla carnea TaxID=189513 RepID=UPI001D0665AC|nr:uncharacterized protein LOC123305164 [Chrysoperla carnea]
MKNCVVKNCKMRIKGLKIKRSLFKVPKNDEMKKKWEAAIPDISVLDNYKFVCEKHFKAEDIIRQRDFRNNTGEIIGVGILRRPELRETAVPCLFENDQEEPEDVSKNQNIDEESMNKEVLENPMDIWIDADLLFEGKNQNISHIVEKNDPGSIEYGEENSKVDDKNLDTNTDKNSATNCITF